MPKNAYVGVTITMGNKCRSRGVITKLASHTQPYTNRKADVLHPPAKFLYMAKSVLIPSNNDKPTVVDPSTKFTV